MGLLDTLVDPRIAGEFAPSEQDRQQAKNQALMMAGLGMIGQKGGFGQAVSNGGMMGLQSYQQSLDNSRRAKMQQLETGLTLQGLLEKQRQKKALEEAMANASPEERQAYQLGVSPTEVWKRKNPERKWVESFDANGRPVKGWADGSGFTQVGGSQAKPVEWQDIGGKIFAKDPFTGLPTGDVLGKTMSPDAAAANNLGWANNAIARGNLDVARFNATKPSYHDGALISPDGNITKTPMFVPPKGSAEANAQASSKVLPIISEAEALLKDSTGSYIGSGLDFAAAAFGKSTKGAEAAAKLKALEGSLMMAQPRMEGPQSDKDVALYRQMAGQIGDTTVPVKTRMAALEQIKKLHEKYAGQTSQQSPQSSMSAGGWSASIIK